MSNATEKEDITIRQVGLLTGMRNEDPSKLVDNFKGTGNLREAINSFIQGHDTYCAQNAVRS